MCWFRKKQKKENQIMSLKNKSYYNNKWAKAPIIYSGRALRGKKDKIGVDVKNFITTNDELLKNIITKYRLKKSNPDDTVWAVQKWVVRYLTYKYDEKQNNCPEFWQFPFESIQSKAGDCEDGAILITSLCINAGVPAWRVKVAAGYVQSSPTAPQGGHAYCIYLANDSDWRIIDWCVVDNRRALVQTPNGNKRISKLKEGDWVIGYDEDKKEPALTQIVKIGNRFSDDLYKIEFENSDYLYVTKEHPFLVDNEWIRADELKEGMEPYWIQPRELYSKFHNYKNDPWRKEAARKSAITRMKNGDYLKLSEKQKKNNVFTWFFTRKLFKNNYMKNLKIMMKAHQTREDGTISGPETKFIEYCEEHNLPIKFVGDGKYWIKTSDGLKNPNFHIPGTKKIIEVSDKSFEYFKNWEDYKVERTELFKEKGYKVEFVLFDRDKFDDSVDVESLHSFALNGNKITKITNIKKDGKTSKYKNGTTVWNMHCEPHNNYIINGNVVHNCYYEDSKTPVARKPRAKDGGYKNCYKDVWFTFNNEFSWNQKSLKVEGRISNNSADLSSNTLEETTQNYDLNSLMEDVEKKYEAK